MILSVIALAQPRQDLLQPPLRSIKELDAWLSDPKQSKISLHALPPIASPAEPVLAPADEKGIQDLIAQLADMKDPDYGLSPTMSGHSFAPVPRSEQSGAFLFTAFGPCEIALFTCTFNRSRELYGVAGQEHPNSE
jgi:hypothetical protein